MEIEGPMMVDGVPGRHSHSGSRLAAETGCVVQHPVNVLPTSYCSSQKMYILESTRLSPLQVSQAEEVAVQLPLTTTAAQTLALQRAPSLLPSLSLAGAQRPRKRTRAATERPSAIQGRDTKR